MKIKELKEIVNSDLPDNIKELMVIQFLANDENALLEMMKILQEERKAKKELISDMNLNLSRAHVFIDELNPNLLAKKERQTNLNEEFTKSFVIDKISEFYVKYKGKISHCFNRFIQIS